VYVSAKYNRFTEISAKVLDKGNMVEEDSITVISRVTGKFFKKNEERISNAFIIGTPDLYVGESIRTAKTIRDAKSSWNVYTFTRAKHKELPDNYFWQGQSYMALTGADEAYFDFCLINTPYNLITRELYNESFKHQDNTTPDWIQLQIVANHIYDKKSFDEYIKIEGININQDDKSRAVYEGFVEIPLAERHHCHHILRDDMAILALYDRVKLCREWMNENLYNLKPEELLQPTN
jgi:hypothetical protein